MDISNQPRAEASTDAGSNAASSEGVKGSGRLFAKMPQLSDRCGGSHDDSVMVPVPDGMNLPDGIVLIRVDE